MRRSRRPASPKRRTCRVGACRRTAPCSRAEVYSPGPFAGLSGSLNSASFRAVKLRIIATLLASVALPHSAVAVMVLILSSGDSSLDTTAQNVFTSAGHTVAIGPQYTAFTGAELSGAQAVLFLANANWNSGDMPVAGQSALVNFVNAGGGLITGEWVNWKVGSGGLTTLAPLMPVTVSTQWTGGSAITYTEALADSVLSAGLPTSFTFPGDNFSGVESFFTAKPGAIAYYTSSGGAGGAGVVAWTQGNGRVLQISTTIGSGQLGTADYARLLNNSVEFVSVPEPSAFALLGLGVLLVWLRRRAAPRDVCRW